MYRNDGKKDLLIPGPFPALLHQQCYFKTGTDAITEIQRSSQKHLIFMSHVSDLIRVHYAWNISLAF